MANYPGNYGITLVELPPPKDYLADSMMPEKREKFNTWWTEHRYDPFLLDEALSEYCMVLYLSYTVLVKSNYSVGCGNTLCINDCTKERVQEDHKKGRSS